MASSGRPRLLSHRSGREPLLIEQGPELATRTTSVSAHAIRCQFSEPGNIAQMSESLDIYETFRDVLGDASIQIDLTQNGYLFASTESDRHRRIQGSGRCASRRLCIGDVELLSGAEILVPVPLDESRDPDWFVSESGWLEQSISVAAANGFATASDSSVMLGTSVRSIETAGGVVTGVQTETGLVQTR